MKKKIILGVSVLAVVVISAVVIFLTLPKDDSAVPEQTEPEQKDAAVVDPATTIGAEGKISYTDSGDTSWEYTKTIAEPLTATGGKDTVVALGDLASHSVAVFIPKGSFDEDSEVKLQTPDQVPNYAGADLEPIGVPIEISAGEPTRLNEKATVEFMFAKEDAATENEAWRLRVIYFDGTEWDLLKPSAIDMAASTATFETYHFSLLGLTKVKSTTKLTENWIHSQALDNQLRGEIDNKVDYVAAQIIDMTLSKMGIEDESIKQKVLSDLLQENGFKDIYDEYQKGDIAAMNQKIALMAGDKIVKLVPESTLSAALGGVVGSADDIAKVGEAIGKIAGGDYKKAARIIGEQIADKFLVTTAGKIAVEVVDYQINSWKNSSIEAAYKAYKNGASAKFWGYNVDPGDFEGVWNQMRGISRQLELEAIKKENAIRVDSGMPKLTSKQEESVRANVKAAMKDQFTDRSRKEEAINKEKEDLKKLIEAFTAANFLESTGPKPLRKHPDIDIKLDLLYHFAKKIMRDTDRFELSDKEGLIMDKKIAISDIVQGARFFFSEPNGEKKYRQFLSDRFGISMHPELSDLAGKWPGTMTITEVILSEENQAAFDELLEQSASSGVELEDLEGCDFDIAQGIKGLEGQSQAITMKLEPTSKTGGNITFASDDPSTSSFTYKDGVIETAFSQDGSVGTMRLTVTENDNRFSAGGTMNISYMEGEMKIKATASVSKGK